MYIDNFYWYITFSIKYYFNKNSRSSTFNLTGTIIPTIHTFSWKIVHTSTRTGNHMLSWKFCKVKLQAEISQSPLNAMVSLAIIGNQNCNFSLYIWVTLHLWNLFLQINNMHLIKNPIINIFPNSALIFETFQQQHWYF